MPEIIKEYDWNWWNDQLCRDQKRLRDQWWNYAEKIVKRYKDKRSDEKRGKKINLFWTNVGIIKSALYARAPKPMISRTWSDANDIQARVGSEILRRCLSYDLMKNLSPMSEAIKKAVDDRLIPGLGCVWFRYQPTIQKFTIPALVLSDGTVASPASEAEEITSEEVICEYTPWRDVIYPSARTREEVWYVARRLYKSAKYIKRRFNKTVSDKLLESMDNLGPNKDFLPKNFGRDRVELIEIWCKRTKKVYWWSQFVPGVMLDEQSDPLGLEDFYPCPDFLMATHTTDDYLPRPDYYMVKDQYDALDELNARISMLEQALRVVGVYDKKNSELKRLLGEAMENDMIPVDNWAMLAESGGLKGAVDFFPIEDIVLVLEKLSVQKKEKVEEIYMLTGISDIMRGTTNPRETLGTQEMKAQYSSVRLQYQQDEVAIFVRQALIIKADIICKHFQPDSIMKLSQIGQSMDAQSAMQAIQMLKTEGVTSYRIDINEEGLALPDYNQEKQMRMDFLTTMGQFLSQSASLLEVKPEALPFMMQIIRWVAAGFRGSNEIQGVFDQALMKLAQPAPQQNAPDPMKDPKVIAAQIKAQDNQQSNQLKYKTSIDSAMVKLKDTVMQNKGDLAEIFAELRARMAEEEANLSNDRERHHMKMKEISHAKKTVDSGS